MLPCQRAQMCLDGLGTLVGRDAPSPARGSGGASAASMCDPSDHLQLIVCSHRGPGGIETPEARADPLVAGPGGLVPVVAAVLRDFGGTWIYAAELPEARAVTVPAQRRGAARIDPRPVAISPAMHRGHYEVVSNAVLARVLHGVLPSTEQRARLMTALEQNWKAYRDVNQVFARAILQEPHRDCLLVEDSHLMLLGSAIRRLTTSAPPISYFHHVAW